MTLWFWVAVAGHLLNAVAFIIDKTLLSKALKNSLTYAVLIGVLPTVVVFGIPWVQAWPSSVISWLAVVIYGSVFVFALWGFFEALKRAETSRIVPIIGSLVPLFTLLGSMIFIGETLGLREYSGLALLIIATWILTHKKGTSVVSFNVVGLCALSALLFAVSSVAGKYAYEREEFLGVFISSRLVGVLVSLSLFTIVTSARREAWAVLRGGAGMQGSKVAGLALFGQGMGATGFLLINYALSLGSATFVNALQAVQYAAIVLIAWFGGKSLNKFLKEDRTPAIMLEKGLAILILAIGLALVL